MKLKHTWRGLILWVFIWFVVVSSAREIVSQASRPPQRQNPEKRIRRSSRDEVSRTGWRIWWEMNKDRYLVLAAGEEQGTTSERTEFFFGRKTCEASRSPHDADSRRSRVIRRLCTALQDKQQEVRFSAAYALGLIGEAVSDDCIAGLKMALSDVSSRVQDASIIALGLSGKASAFEPLASILDGDSSGAKRTGDDSVSDRRRSLAALAIGLLKDPRGFEKLVQIAGSRDHSIETRIPAVTALGMLREPKSWPFLKELASRRGVPIRLAAAAINAIGRLAMPESMETVALALEDRHAEVRRSAVLALGIMVPRILGESLEQKEDGSRPAKMNRPDTIFRIRFRDFCRRQLADIAREDVFRVRAAACVTLGQVGGSKDRELLETLLNDGNQDIGNLAAIGLGILGRRGFDPEKSGWKSLCDAFEKSVAHDRSGALALALGLYGEKAAAGLISKRLRETEARRLQAYFFMALAILGQMPSEKVVTELLLASRDEDTLQDTLLGLSLVPARQEVVSLLHEKLVEGEDLRERAIAATGLVLLGSVPDAEPVSMLIGRSEIPDEFRSMIIEGLGMAGNERGMNPAAYLTLGFNEAHATAAERFLMSLKW